MTWQWTLHMFSNGQWRDSEHFTCAAMVRDMIVSTSRVWQWPATWQWTLHMCSSGPWRDSEHFTCTAMIRDVTVNTYVYSNGQWRDSEHFTCAAMSVIWQWTRHVCSSGPYRDMTVGTSRVQQWPVTWQWTFHVCSNGPWRGSEHCMCAAMSVTVDGREVLKGRQLPFFWVENVLLDIVPSAALLDKSSFLFLWLSATALPSVPSKLVLTLTSSNSVLTNSFSDTHLLNSLPLALHRSPLPAFKTWLSK